MVTTGLVSLRCTTSCVVAKNTLVRTQSQSQPLDPQELQSNDRAKNEVAFRQLFNGAKRISLARLYNVQQCHLISRL